MKIHWIFGEDIRYKTNVVYEITLYVGSHEKEYHYIGKTSRQLEKRIKEHINNSKCPVGQMIRECDVKRMSVVVLYECDYYDRLNLDMYETRELCRYYKERGTIANQRNRLINRDLKGLELYTLADIKTKFAQMNILLG